MQSTQPRPERFQIYTQLPNGKGFKIKDSKYIYLFDKYGGFYDQYNNYYNPDGSPEDPPSDQDQDFERFILQDSYQDDYQQDDYYENQYGVNSKHKTYVQEQDYEEQQPQVASNPYLADIARNVAILHQYPLKTPLRVDFSNMSFKVAKQQILTYYKSKVQGILNVILEKQGGKFIGQGYFVLDQVNNAQKLIKLEGQEFKGRKVYFDVQSLDQFLRDPVTKQERNILIEQQQFQSLVKEQPKKEEVKEQNNNKKKKFIDKSNLKAQQQSKKPEQNKKQLKPEIKKQEKIQKVVQKPKVIEPIWQTYKADLTMFPLKDSFFKWMKQQNFNQNEHFKNIKKFQPAVQNKKIKIIEIRSDALEKIQNSTYENQKVYFQKLN